ncbi:MAG: transporter substrate-binding domain-containing protein [Spirochaetia bacterium]|nr:transporter substrate-binding domain-containing protein [Spirochaetia bacterium]
MKKIVFYIIYIFVFSYYLTAEEPVIRENTFNDIIRKKEIKIGISMNYPPLNFEKDNKKIGIEIEMANSLAEFLNVKPVFIPLSVDSYVNALEKKEVDVILAGLSRDLIRAKRIWFSEPYFQVTPAVFTDKKKIPQTKFGEFFEETPYKNIWDLKRKQNFIFAVKKASVYEDLIKTEFSEHRLVIVENNQQGIDSVLTGKAFGFVHDSLFLEYYMQENSKLKSGYVILKGGKRAEKICVGLPFGDIILKNQINLWVGELIRQGLIEKWLQEHMNQ